MPETNAQKLPSSPSLFLYLQSCRYRNPGEYIPVFPLDGPKLRFGYYPHLAPEGEGCTCGIMIILWSDFITLSLRERGDRLKVI